MKEIVIIGGGASGLFAAVALKTELQENVKITIVERLERVGKKLLATGSGKANLSNESAKGSKYNQPSFVTKLLKKFGYKETLEFFSKIGLKTMTGTEGRIYPKSENASSLLDVLRNKIRDFGIEEKCNFEVKKVHLEKDKYVIESTRGLRLTSDYVILAAGGKASPILGSNGTGYHIAKTLKMKVTDTYPGLVGVKTDDTCIRGLEGLRVKAEVSLFAKRNKEPIWKSFGEVQFKSETVSGIVIMDMATQIARNELNENLHISHFSLDLCPEYTLEELIIELNERKSNLHNYSNANFLIGMFHKMMCNQILKRAKVDVAGYVENVTNREIERIAKTIKNFVIEYKHLDSFDHAQVTVGGIDIKEVVPESLESRKNAGLYICGEILDIDGNCGGYNLQWAWTSAYIVSKSISDRVKSSL